MHQIFSGAGSKIHPYQQYYVKKIKEINQSVWAGCGFSTQSWVFKYSISSTAVPYNFQPDTALQVPHSEPQKTSFHSTAKDFGRVNLGCVQGTLNTNAPRTIKLFLLKETNPNNTAENLTTDPNLNPFQLSTGLFRHYGFLELCKIHGLKPILVEDTNFCKLQSAMPQGFRRKKKIKHFVC